MRVYRFVDLNIVDGLICGSRLQKKDEQHDFLVNVVDKVRKGEFPRRKWKRTHGIWRKYSETSFVE